VRVPAVHTPEAESTRGVERIALDATLWDEPTTGIGLYTKRLSAGLEALGVQVLRVGARTSGDHPRGGSGKSAYVLGQLPRALPGMQAQLFHATGNFNLPLRKVPGTAFVLTVHDVIPLLLPKTVSRAFRWQFRLWLSRSLRVADRVVCISETTRRDLLGQFDVSPDKVSVVPLGLDHVDEVPPLDATGEAYLRTLGLPEGFLLYAGSLDARKNVGLVLEALKVLASRGERPTLVLVGQSWFGSAPLEREIASMRQAGFDLRPLGYQPAPILYALMRRAGLFLFPSRYEGFGLPPLEAMRLGTPALISTAGALVEVCGEGAVAVEPDDVGALAQAISLHRRDAAARAALAAKGQAVARKFSWRNTAEQTLAVYRRARGFQWPGGRA
jgi:glycosyltransferase involved in cell wall biosynthesis